MSNSYRKAIVRDKPRNAKRTSLYWRTIRRNIKNKVSSFKNKWMDPYQFIELDELPRDFKDIEFLEDTIPSPKALINDYSYEDFKLDYEFDRGRQKWGTMAEKFRNKYRRK